MPQLDRTRAQRLMRAAGIDAMVLFQPENFTYATGLVPGVAAMWRRAGAVAALVPSDATARVVALVGDLNPPSAPPDVDLRTHRLWVDTVDLSGWSRIGGEPAEIVAAAYRKQGNTPRPETFDFQGVLKMLADVLGERGLSRARLGVDLAFVSVADWQIITAALPALVWVDCSPTIRELRAIKSPAEIALLRRAAAYAEAGIVAVRDSIAEGVSQRALSLCWRNAVTAAAEGAPDLTGMWDFVSVGPDLWKGSGVVRQGAVIKADVGAVVGGYSSDGARTFVFGSSDPIVRYVYPALQEAFEAGLAAIRPGTLLRDVYAATAGRLARSLPGYRRGHFGHGVGASVGSEEWPFISANSDTVIEPGMVLAFETPFYGDGLGALMIEDQLLVTSDGIETMMTLPRELVRL